MGSTIQIKRGEKTAESTLLDGELAFDSINKILYIGGQNYIELTSQETSGKNPYEQGWYVKMSSNPDKYIRTDDTTVQSGRTYYRLDSVCDINISGTASQAPDSQHALGAQRLEQKNSDNSYTNYSVGSNTCPVYFNNGIPVALSSLAIANGGTGATSADTARTNLGINYSSTIPASDSASGSAGTQGSVSHSDHSHPYPTQLNSSIDVGNATLPIYILDGVPTAINTTGVGISITGNANTATTLANARTITINGAVSGNTTFNGSQDVTITTTLSTVQVNQGGTGATNVQDARTNLQIKVGNTPPEDVNLNNGDIYFYYQDEV